MVIAMKLHKSCPPVTFFIACLTCFAFQSGDRPSPRLHVDLRAIYGGFPEEIFRAGKTLSDYGINAVFMGSGSLTEERVSRLKEQGARVFAEFNSMHEADYLKDHPDAHPIGVTGEPEPPAEGWQGVCPTHPGYRANRMKAFRDVLTSFEIDGIWLDYHHSHASWERAVPLLPDTCFCDRCLTRFQKETGVRLGELSKPAAITRLLKKDRAVWVKWRCDLFTDWVREYRSILDETRPSALLGSFHCPWNLQDFEGALREKLAIDLRAQAKYLHVFSPMPYHARFGHSKDPAWISRQVKWLGEHLGINGQGGDEARIWPIVQLSDWGEPVGVEQVTAVLDHGSRPPATGVIVFAWGSFREQPAKVEELGRFYKAISAQ